MTFQEFPELIKKIREKYPVSSVELQFPNESRDTNDFFVRVDISIPTTDINEYGTVWRSAGWRSIDEVADMLFRDLKSEIED